MSEKNEENVEDEEANIFKLYKKNAV